MESTGFLVAIIICFAIHGVTIVSLIACTSELFRLQEKLDNRYDSLNEDADSTSSGGVADYGVSFEAFSEETRFYDESDRYRFDTIVSNEGGHYDNTLYQFTCPYRGVYSLTVNITHQGGGVEAALSIDGNNYLYANGENGVTYGSFAVPCDEGQNVWVEVEDGDSAVNAIRTFISGYLILRY